MKVDFINCWMDVIGTAIISLQPPAKCLATSLNHHNELQTFYNNLRDSIGSGRNILYENSQISLFFILYYRAMSFERVTGHYHSTYL
jgi:hypothetical protein